MWMQQHLGLTVRGITPSSCAKWHKIVSGFNWLWVTAAAYLQMWLNGSNVIMRLTAFKVVFLFSFSYKKQQEKMWSHDIPTVYPINNLTQAVCLQSDLMLNLTHGEQTKVEGADSNSVDDQIAKAKRWINFPKWSHVTVSCAESS